MGTTFRPGPEGPCSDHRLAGARQIPRPRSLSAARPSSGSSRPQNSLPLPRPTRGFPRDSSSDDKRRRSYAPPSKPRSQCGHIGGSGLCKRCGQTLNAGLEDPQGAREMEPRAERNGKGRQARGQPSARAHFPVRAHPRTSRPSSFRSYVGQVGR